MSTNGHRKELGARPALSAAERSQEPGSLVPVLPSLAHGRGAGGEGPLDTLRRPLHDLRISVTDRCNFRCTYCMPKEIFGREYQFLDRREILSFEEITRLTRIFVSLGVEKVRLTGGEPTLRRDLPKLVAMLSEIEGL